MRCPNCDREEVDLIGKSEITGGGRNGADLVLAAYGCPRCHTMFTIDPEPYEAVDESELKADWETQAQKLKEGFPNISIM